MRCTRGGELLQSKLCWKGKMIWVQVFSPAGPICYFPPLCESSQWAFDCTVVGLGLSMPRLPDLWIIKHWHTTEREEQNLIDYSGIGGCSSASRVTTTSRCHHHLSVVHWGQSEGWHFMETVWAYACGPCHKLGQPTPCPQLSLKGSFNIPSACPPQPHLDPLWCPIPSKQRSCAKMSLENSTTL